MSDADSKPKSSADSSTNVDFAPFWAILSKYPASLQTPFLQLKTAHSDYLKGEYPNGTPFSVHFVSKFDKYLRQGHNIDIAFLKAGGLRTEYAWDWSRFKIRQYYHAHRRIPPASDVLFSAIKTRFLKNSRADHPSWNWYDLCASVLPKYSPTDANLRLIRTDAALTRARRVIEDYYRTRGIIPLKSAPEVKFIVKLLRRNPWTEFGIIQYSDLIHHIFGSNAPIIHCWKGKQGVDQAARWLRTAYDPIGHKLSKKGKEYHGILKALVDKRWAEYHITTWEELFSYALGYIPDLPKQLSKPEQFAEDQARLREHYRIHQTLPVSNDFPAIARRCAKQVWAEFGITSWNDLLRVLFGRVNKIR